MSSQPTCPLHGGGTPPARGGGVAAPDVGWRKAVLKDEALGFAAAAEERAVGVPEEGWACGLTSPQDALRHWKGELVECVIALPSQTSLW